MSKEKEFGRQSGRFVTVLIPSKLFPLFSFFRLSGSRPLGQVYFGRPVRAGPGPAAVLPEAQQTGLRGPAADLGPEEARGLLTLQRCQVPAHYCPLTVRKIPLLACSVWEIHGQCQEVDLDDQEDQEVVEAQTEKRMAKQLKGTCWVCKWALNKVKKSISTSSSQETLKQKLLSVCDKVGFLKSMCKGLVKKHLWVLIEELSTSDDVRTICVNIKACKQKEVLDLSY
uniref:Antimicrobial peptide NK-lysin-like n=1 Tax=Salmo trutta TaxID=8032 RepID=A0A674F7T8_SALTR